LGARIGELFDLPVRGKDSYGLEDIKSPDDLRQHYAFTIQTNPEETERAIQIIKDLKADDYLTYARNCTTTCADILRKLKLHQNREIIPQALFYNFAEEHGNSSIPYPAHNGTDYGKPRGGYNAFDLLYLTLKTCHTQTAHWTENGKDTGTTSITVCN
jgi:plasmid stabilization system protein ParE